MKLKLTQSTVEKLVKSQCPASGSVIVWDKRGGGFGLRLTALGVASFILNYRVAGRERRYTIGRWGTSPQEHSADSAYAEAVDLLTKIKDGFDPLAPAEDLAATQTGRTFADLAKDYMENAESYKRPHTLYDDHGMLRSVILPRLGPKLLASIEQQDIQSLHRSLKATPHRGNRVRALLSSMFRHAINNGWLTTNPVTGIPRYPEPPREVWLSKEQVGALKKALAAYSAQDTANAIRLLLLTGARPGELLGAQWDALDLKAATWFKPSCATKQKKNEYVPLNPPALALLKKMSANRNGSAFLFPSHARDGKAQALKSLKWAWAKVRETAGLPPVVINGKPKEVRLYDLRHTFASHCVQNGASLYLVGKLLGHTRAQTTQRYAHVDDAATRKTTENFAANIGW